MLQEFILPALSFAVAAAVIPGPLIAYLVNTTLTQGWRKALLVVSAPLLTDAPIIVLMTVVLGQMPAEFLRLIQVGGGLLLLYIARGAYQQYRAESVDAFAADNDRQPVTSAHRILLTSVLMNILSPGPWLFWGTVNGPLMVKALDQSVWHALAFLLCFYGVFLLGLGGWVAVFHHAQRVQQARLRYLILATSLLLLWFGIGLITAALVQEQLQPLIVTLIIAAEAPRSLRRWRLPEPSKVDAEPN